MSIVRLPITGDTMRVSRPSYYACAVLSFLMLGALPSNGQEIPGCTTAPSTDGPARRVYECGDTLVFEREPVAQLRVQLRAGSDIPRTIEVKGGAILIEVDPGSPSTQIRTPNAIATVRGTKYVVDAAASQTSVFVMEGEVDVRAATGVTSVVVGAGEGIDVADGLPLEVVTWGEGRKAELLARFGR